MGIHGVWGKHVTQVGPRLLTPNVRHNMVSPALHYQLHGFSGIIFFQELFQFWNLTTIFTHVRGPWKKGKVTQTLKFRIHEACNAAYPQNGNVCNVTRALYNTTNISPGVPARAWNTWLAAPGVWRWGSEERNSGTCKGWCHGWCSTPVQVLPRHPGQLWLMMMLHLPVVCTGLLTPLYHHPHSVVNKVHTCE